MEGLLKLKGLFKLKSPPHIEPKDKINTLLTSLSQYVFKLQNLAFSAQIYGTQEISVKKNQSVNYCIDPKLGK